MRRMDWAGTPLGVPDSWPQSLRSTLSMLLPSKAQIIAHSDGAGTGSEFIIRLPLASASAEVRTGERPKAKGARAGSSRRILVVDDNTDGARLLADALELVGHETRLAFDGPTALVAAADFRPDAALLDLGLPVMDGYELAGQMIARSKGRRRPVLVAVTGYGQASDQERTRAAGFDAHVVKPVDIPRLISLVESLLARTATVLHSGGPEA